jgi:hypothetical protein
MTEDGLLRAYFSSNLLEEKVESITEVTDTLTGSFANAKVLGKGVL